MSEPNDIPPADRAALVALADGRLEPERRAALEERLAREPALAAALDRQRAAITAITAAAAEVRAPASLRAKIEAMRAEAAAAPPAPEVRDVPRRRAFRLSLPRISWLPAAGLAAAAAAVVLLLVLPGGGPAVDDALAAASRPPTAAAAVDPAQPRLLRQQQDGVRFPNYAAKFGWRAAGTRTDEIGGHHTRTVFYEKGGRRIAYTIVGGKALDEPGGRRVTVEGTRLIVFKPAAVTWERQSRTCVMSGEGVPQRELLSLASWKGKGAVEF